MGKSLGGSDLEDKMAIRCICGREVTLELLGGQYQDTYQGECECGRKWSLEEQSELLAEILEWQKGSDKYGLEGR